jgi:hypothetical protein
VNAAGLIALVFAAALLGGCGGGQHQKSDWEKQNEARLALEDDTLPASELPRYPRAQDLIEFTISAPDGFRFFIDRDSIAVKEGVVRYTLVARSPSGVETVNFEGLRCKTNEHRIYAFGRPDGSWSMSAVSWREISANTTQRWQKTLQRDFFCVSNKPIANAKEGITGLEKGMHPWLKSVDGNANPAQ